MFYFGDYKKIQPATRVNSWLHDEKVIAEVLRDGTVRDHRLDGTRYFGEPEPTPLVVKDHLRYRAEGARALDMARMADRNPRRWASWLAWRARRHAKGCYTAAARIILFRRAREAGDEVPSAKGPGPWARRNDGTMPGEEG